MKITKIKELAKENDIDAEERENILLDLMSSKKTIH